MTTTMKRITLVAVAFGLTGIVAGCQLIVDFDRTLIDAGASDASIDTSKPDTGTPDASDGGTTDASDGSTTDASDGSTTDASDGSTTDASDSGSDADPDASDAASE